MPRWKRGLVAGGAAVVAGMLPVWWYTSHVRVTLNRSWGIVKLERGLLCVELWDRSGLDTGHLVDYYGYPWYPADRSLQGRYGLVLPRYSRNDEGCPTLKVPFWILPGTLIVSGLLLVRPWRAWRVSEKDCRICAYDLTGNQSGICPECGTSLTMKAPSWHVRARQVGRRRGALWLSIGVVLAFGVGFAMRSVGRQMQCSTNFRHISRAFYSYACPDQGDKFPSTDFDWRREFLGCELDAADLVCPAMAAHGHSYIYVPGYGCGPSQGNPDQILLFEDPSNHRIGGHVLRLDTRVEWYFEPEYSRIINGVTRPDGTKAWPPPEK